MFGIWLNYLAYLEQWAEEHRDLKHYGESPKSFADWEAEKGIISISYED